MGSGNSFPMGAVFTADDARHILAQALTCVFPLHPDGICFFLQLILQLDIQMGIENAAENALPLLGIGQQQLQEIALCDHGNLRKLFPIQTNDLADGSIDIFQLGDHLAVRHGQAGIGSFFGKAFAPLLGALIFGIALDGIGAAAIQEGQLYFRGGFGRGIFGAEHGRLPRIAAGFAVKSEGDGIENGGLTGTGVAGDQIQATAAQLLKVQHDRFCIGAEGGHGQFQRSHWLPSHTDSNSSSI